MKARWAAVSAAEAAARAEAPWAPMTMTGRADPRTHERNIDKSKLGLTGADQLHIDFGKQFGIEQRAVFGAPRIVDPIALAKIIESVRSARILAARQHQGVDQPLPPRSACASRAPAPH